MNCSNMFVNQISFILFFFSFQYLYLEGNELTSLPDDFFDCLPRLTWLDLRRNKLLRLPSVYTGRHNHLRTLLLEGNKLRSLPLELGKTRISNDMLIFTSCRSVSYMLAGMGDQRATCTCCDNVLKKK